MINQEIDLPQIERGEFREKTNLEKRGKQARAPTLETKMPMHDKSPGGKFMVIDGIDGTGKTTLSSMLCQFLKENGIAVLLTREPTDGIAGKLCKDIARANSGNRENARMEALMYTADRADHIEREIRPALEQKKWVICDRYYLSTICYQNAIDNSVGIDWLRQVNSFAIEPDLTFVLDCDPEITLNRIELQKRYASKYERKDYLSKVRMNFKECVKMFSIPYSVRPPPSAPPPGTFLVPARKYLPEFPPDNPSNYNLKSSITKEKVTIIEIDASRSISSTFDAIVCHVKRFLPKQ